MRKPDIIHIQHFRGERKRFRKFVRLWCSFQGSPVAVPKPVTAKLRGLGEVLLGDISAVMVICDAAGKSEHEQRKEGHSIAARMSAGRVQGESRDKDMRTLQELRKAKGLIAYQLDEAAGTGKGFTTRLECGVTNPDSLSFQ